MDTYNQCMLLGHMINNLRLMVLKWTLSMIQPINGMDNLMEPKTVSKTFIAFLSFLLGV